MSFRQIEGYIQIKHKEQETLKHQNKEQLKKQRRRKLKIIIFLELILVAAACYGLLMQSSYNVLMRKAASTYDQIMQVKGEDFREPIVEILKTARERIVEENEEYLWTKEALSYRKGPDESYAEAGSLDAEKMVICTGVTWNKWTRIVIDEEEYYIESEQLTDETPISALLASGQKGEYQKYALSLFPDFGWSDRELEPLINLWNRESHWNPNAHNKSSGAHGIPQALPAGKMASEGSDYYTNGNTQIRWGLKYIARRYGSPSAAWSFFQSHNSY